MGISDIKKKNNPDIINIVSLYITNMSGLNEAEGYANANKILDLITRKRTQIFNLLCKMKDAGILEKYSSKDNYPQLNHLETSIRTTLADSIRKAITDSSTGRLDTNKFAKNFAAFVEDEEIKQLGRNAIDSSRNAEDKKGYLRPNRGNTESDGKEAVRELVEKMVDIILKDYQSYEEYIYACQTPINLNDVYLKLNSYFQERIASMQEFSLQYGLTEPIR